MGIILLVAVLLAHKRDVCRFVQYLELLSRLDKESDSRHAAAVQVDKMAGILEQHRVCLPAANIIFDLH